MLKQWLCGLLMVLALPVMADDSIGQDPYQVVQVVAQRSFDRFAADQALIAANLDHLKVIVEEEMMPYVDYKYAAYKVMGPTLKKTTPEQRERFTEEFRRYMIATFAQAFTEYRDQTVEFDPAKPFEGRNIVTVGMTVIDGNRPPISVQFKARRNKKTGEWKAFDLVAEGVSLLASKEQEIGGLIRRNGIDAVTDMLAEKNNAHLVDDKEAAS
ncbi:MlaC/ttg2D family ABC transporter substrate-binding protein [Ferrimonas balearica]|uniref:MlaC/ttg2D family ABC transporter substrate-binding protein n=1 Tax=Ferrimonas balearica TaxID=44012 RepID=UPI001F2F4B1A|nr:phospholipid-binding protein MlaC [Ferrimonas balearica]MBY6019088.1 phospholipid-binding protein MlaC [Halomonas denitrificans]MBY6095692.1 phospholipid-binding protein MlaC [Ferrimonas balearica]